MELVILKSKTQIVSLDQKNLLSIHVEQDLGITPTNILTLSLTKEVTPLELRHVKQRIGFGEKAVFWRGGDPYVLANLASLGFYNIYILDSKGGIRKI